MTVKCPSTPNSKIDKSSAASTPVSTPASRVNRTPASTPGGPKAAKEDKIVVTVRLRPLSTREQAAKDQVAWECIDEQTIVHKTPVNDRSMQPSSFTFGNVHKFFHLSPSIVHQTIILVIFFAHRQSIRSGVCD